MSSRPAWLIYQVLGSQSYTVPQTYMPTVLGEAGSISSSTKHVKKKTSTPGTVCQPMDIGEPQDRVGSRILWGRKPHHLQDSTYKLKHKMRHCRKPQASSQQHPSQVCHRPKWLNPFNPILRQFGLAKHSWHISVIPTFRKQRQEDHHKFKSSLSYSQKNRKQETKLMA